MKTSAKIIFGVASIATFPVTFILFGAFFWLVSSYQDPKDLIRFIEQHEIAIGFINLAITAFFGGLHLMFIIHSARNPNLDSMKSTWIVCIIIFGTFAFPFYWYHHIWHEGKSARSTGPLGLSDG